MEERRKGKINKMGIKNASQISDPTASEAINNVMLLPYVKINDKNLELPEVWLDVVRGTYKWCKEQADNLYEIAKRRYKGIDYRKICSEMSISQSTLSKMIDKVKTRALLLAVQAGLIRVEPYIRYNEASYIRYNNGILVI